MHTLHLVMAAVVMVVISFHLLMPTGSSHRVQVMDTVNAGVNEMSLKDWMVYYNSVDHGGRLLTMTVEFSRSKLEKCLQLPEIVCFVLSVSSNIVCM